MADAKPLRHLSKHQAGRQLLANSVWAPKPGRYVLARLDFVSPKVRVAFACHSRCHARTLQASTSLRPLRMADSKTGPSDGFDKARRPCHLDVLVSRRRWSGIPLSVTMLECARSLSMPVDFNYYAAGNIERNGGPIWRYGRQEWIRQPTRDAARRREEKCCSPTRFLANYPSIGLSLATRLAALAGTERAGQSCALLLRLWGIRFLILEIFSRSSCAATCKPQLMADILERAPQQATGHR